MSYEEKLDWLFRQLPMFSRVGQAAYKPGLERSWALARHFGNPQDKWPSIHIAGTNGKGSVSHLIASTLQSQGYKVGLYTSPHLVDFRERMRVNGTMIPKDAVERFIDRWRAMADEYPDKPSFFELTMMMAFTWFADEQVDYAVIETGMNHFGEIEYLGAMVRPDIAVISNIGDAHIEYLGSREGILKAKCEIFEHLKADGVAILNGDDALLDTVTLPQRIVRCGQSEHCETRISDIVDHGVDGITCTVTTARDTYALTIPAPGEHMAYSASMAVAVGEELGLSREEIVRGVAAYEPTGSRMRVIRLPGGRVLLDDCYNANPQSVTAALEVLGRTDCERRVAVLGDMGELGDLTDQAHFNAGALAAMLGIDFVIAIGSKAARIADGAAMSGGDVVHFATKEEALPTVREQLRPNTSMLIKASHSMRFERLTEDLRKYYD